MFLAMMQVQSVDSYKGTVAGCCAASHDGTIVVYPATVVPGEMAKQKAFWRAHDRTITVLHANRFCPTLLSGDDSGEIRMYVTWHHRDVLSHVVGAVLDNLCCKKMHSSKLLFHNSCSSSQTTAEVWGKTVFDVVVVQRLKSRGRQCLT